MVLFIYASSLGYSRHIKDEPFVKRTRNKSQPFVSLVSRII